MSNASYWVDLFGGRTKDLGLPEKRGPNPETNGGIIKVRGKNGPREGGREGGGGLDALSLSAVTRPRPSSLSVQPEPAKRGFTNLNVAEINMRPNLITLVKMHL